MSKADELRDRLAAALDESTQADRTWLDAMKHDARCENEGSDDVGERQRLDRLWRERETTNRKVESLHKAVAEALAPGPSRLWYRALRKKLC